MRMKKRFWLILYTVVHFLVDLSCIYFLTGIMIPRAADHDEWLFVAVLYNMLAFALPMVLGLLADSWKRNVRTAAIGCFCVASGYIFWKASYPAVLLLGVGNGLFHIGGGRQILEDSREQYAPCGVFISSGALGVYLGSLWGTAYYPLRRFFLVVMLACTILLWVLRRKEPGRAKAVIPKKTGAAATCIFLVVCIRSYYGTILNYSWKNGMAIGLVFTLCIVAGKFSGGFLADWLGIIPAIWISLGTAAVLAVLSFSSPVCGCISVCFFNMTMPLTLSLLVHLMPEKPGFAFGMLMFGLFLGTLPMMLWKENRLFSSAGLFGLCMVSLFLLLWAADAERKRVHDH